MVKFNSPVFVKHCQFHSTVRQIKYSWKIDCVSWYLTSVYLAKSVIKYRE